MNNDERIAWWVFLLLSLMTPRGRRAMVKTLAQIGWLCR